MKLAALVFGFFSGVSVLCAQTAALQGQATDESGAVIPNAAVTLTGASNKSTTASADGRYSFVGLAPGVYSIQATAPELVLPQPIKITLKAGVQSLNLRMQVASTSQQLTVQETADPSITTDPSNNAGALVLKGDDLQALADDPDDLAADLQALAGPSAGPNGGAIYVDGFSGGQLPSKESIREIRVNQNPFSAEYDKLGFGRIEIFTKPGMDKFRGTGYFNFGDSFWNTRNPYAAEKASFNLKEYGGNLSGPINKKSSFFLDVRRDSVNNGDVINAVILNPADLAITPYTGVFVTPQRRIMVSPRVDYQLNANNTLTVRYAYNRADIQDSGIGGFNLVERGYHLFYPSQTLQVSETAVIGSSVVNETRFQFFRLSTDTNSNTPGPAILVLGSFNGGGAQTGQASNVQNNYELQNYTSVAHGTHSFRFGVRLRGQTIADTSPQNFGGTFTFGGGLAPELDANNNPLPTLVQITSIERYQRTLLFQQEGYSPDQIRALGGGATQFTMNGGNPSLSVGQFDLGAFAGDDWRVRPHLTLSLGLRYETQTNIHNWSDVAPRIGVAWAPKSRSGKPSKNVFRGGFGIFYDRFPLTNTLTADRYDGVVQQQYVIANPDFFPHVPPAAALAGSQAVQAIQQVSSTIRAPYTMQSAVGWERQLPRNTTVAVTYANAHGLHLFRSAVLNAPANPIYLMESSGLYNQNQLITNVNSKMNSSLSFFGSYVYNRALSNTDGLSTFPGNPNSSVGEYGPAATDIHHQMSFGGTALTRWNIRFSPLIVLASGPPFNITAGHDVYNDTLFNARPGFASDPNKPGLIATQYGLLDPNPTPNERIVPRNYGRGPGTFSVNLRLGKIFAFGPSREGGGVASGIPGDGNRGNANVFGSAQGGGGAQTNRRYNLSVSMSIRNLLNHTNPGPIIGNITSPLFGQANQPVGSGGMGFSESANNRRLELQMRFTF